MDDPIIKQAFELTHPSALETCGLGWHIYKNEDEVIAYQYGANPNTRSFVAINLTEKKGAAFFTNSENGMAITNQVFGSPTLAPIGNPQNLYNHLNKHIHYTPSDEPGWQETISGKTAEIDGKFEEAKDYFERALQLSPQNESIQKRLEWFNKVHHPSPKKEFITPLQAFVGNYKNLYNDDLEMSIKEESLMFEQFDQEIKLIQISETEFLPEKDQLFKIRFDGNQMSMSYVFGGPDKRLSKQISPKLQSQGTSSQEQIQKQYHFKGAVEHVRIEEKKSEQLDGFEKNNHTRPTPFSIKPKPQGEG
jgi:tetratricopeptide (TPR) repeat protein